MKAVYGGPVEARLCNDFNDEFHSTAYDSLGMGKAAYFFFLHIIVQREHD